MKTLKNKEDYTNLLDSYDTWLFDCDGVLWHGDRLIDGALDVLALLRKHNKHILFVTNNATKSRRQYKAKFDNLGVEAHVDEIFGSAYASAVYISSVMQLPKDKKVYVIGEAGLEEELANEGLSFVGGTAPEDCAAGGFSFATYEHDDSVAAVYSKAFQYLTRNPGCAFIATNEDSTYPAGAGMLPGAGSISAPLRYATKKDPIAVGKPNKTMLDCIRAKHDFDPKRAVMVGDRLDTDILFGQSGGLATLLVLTGVTQVEEVQGPDAKVLPDFVTASIGDLCAAS
ncbi:p-nitrophenyl phosphatase [Auriculariales sp. MPI-PUGE-AT-0066]|nr:p-nitrophenyl phosphatase [Auriculariales sp. MPI-PUGE-AT-0066]